jgi:tetratricopeptide (TPR) repeat protein
MKPFFASRISLLITAIIMLNGCSSLSDIRLRPQSKNDSDMLNPQSTIVKLSQEEQAKRDGLLEGKTFRPTLRSLNLQAVKIAKVDIPTLSLVDKRDEYQALLPLISDPIQQQQVAFRLADIKMLIAEQQQQEASSTENLLSAFTDAISDYKAVINEHSIISPVAGIALTPEQQVLNRKQMDAMYQLTRALDLAAKPDESVKVAKDFLHTFDAQKFGTTPYHLELYFRIGEYYFNRQNYTNAVEYYEQVVMYTIDSDFFTKQTTFYAISAYMLGWSHFKLDDYPNALQGFAKMLDASLYNVPTLTSTAIHQLELSKGELRQVKDSVRVMALTFSYQGDAQAIAAFFDVFGNRDYEHLIYDELAQQHLDNDRFQDSANALVAFASDYPSHPRAIEFYIRHIDAFVLGKFPDRVLLAKERFVHTYSLGNGLVTSFDTPIGRDAVPYLQDYIKKLAQSEHSIAQSIEALLVARQQVTKPVTHVITSEMAQTAKSGFIASSLATQQSAGWHLASNANLQALSRQAYRKAKNYYKNYISSFSPNEEVAQLRFYLAEALFALQEYEQAIIEFETYAYFDEPNPQAAEAAYAALLSYEQIAEDKLLNSASNTLSDSGQTLIKFLAPLTNRQSSQAKFAQTFADEALAAMVALTLMQELFIQKNYVRAQTWASWIITKTPNPMVTLAMQESAALVMAHSYFAMDNFAEAERAYRNLLANLAPQNKKHAELSNRLAASLYKQAERILVRDRLDTASLQANKITNKSQLSEQQLVIVDQGIGFLQKVVKDTPLSEFRLAAQFDSAVYFLLLERWPEAIATFLDFQQRFSQHPLAQGIDEQLFYAYQQTQDWSQAATILLAKYEASANTETGRLALYQAAEFYAKANDKVNAFQNFRRYAHQYPMPIADANEARFKLSEHYLANGDDSKRRFWLNKLVQAQLDIEEKNPQFSSPRSVYLASMSAMVFATDADNAFTRIKLTQPLAKSLQKKQAALKKAIYEYKRIMAFGSKDYVAAANFKLANLYLTLADDLMNSSRPRNLSALALSQYEILLEEQAYPFEETAINLHENNIARVQSGLYDTWVKQSFGKLKTVMPGRYYKPEIMQELSADDF